MNTTEASAEIKARAAELLPLILSPAKSRVNKQQSYICPICGHGAHGDGLAINPRGRNNSLKCFGCNFSGSIIDLYMQTEGLSYTEAVSSLSAKLGIDVETRSRQDAAAAHEHKAAASDPDQEPAADELAGLKAAVDAARAGETGRDAQEDAAYFAAADYCFHVFNKTGKLDAELMAELSLYTGKFLQNAEDIISLFEDAGCYARFNEETATKQAAGKELQAAAEKTPETAKNEGIEQELKHYFVECMNRIHDPAAVSYLQARGISIENAIRHGIGFDPAADPAGKGYAGPRIIIPTSSSHYVGRSTDPKIDKKYAKMNNKGGKAGIFNSSAIYSGNEAVFVVEGAFDALSVMEAENAAAVALNSTSNSRLLLDQLKEKPAKDTTFILCLDNDDAGARAREELREGLQRMNIPFIVTDICNGQKDANDALQADRAAFIAAVEEAQRQTAARPDSITAYIDQFMAADIDQFKNEIKTGYSELDRMTGGLYAGLYVVAAISSLGKTTFCHQMADQMAAAGNEVLYFSLEQSRLELITKSIARRMALDRYADNMAGAVSSLAIRKGYLPAAVLDTIDEYKKAVADHFSIIEGNFNCNISFIGDYIRKYIKKTGCRPVVFIDYLQILQPEMQGNRMQTTKETVDTTVTELKRLSREMGLTIIAISSVNRANYLTPIDFESLKESGGIEYTADVVLGLQLQCLQRPEFDKANNVKEQREIVKQAKAATPRQIELVCLKNRYGVASFSDNFEYWPANDLFIEQVQEQPQETPARRKRR